ncbi:hypothetical protein V8E52_004280 [Russula decolorans]
MHRLPCCHPDCPATFKSQHGRTYHIRAVHTNFNSRSINREDDQGLGHHEQDDVHRLTDAGSADGWDTQAGTASVPLDKNTVCGGERIQHPYLTDGNFLPPGVPPPRRETQPQGDLDWAPFDDRVQFELADFLFRDAALSASKVNTLLDLWTRSIFEFDAPGPMKNHGELHTLIDSSTLGDVPWQYTYEVWYRNPEIVVSNMLANPDFDGQFDLRPYIDLDKHQKRRWSNVMSGNVAWRHSDDICASVPNSVAAALEPELAESRAGS